MKLYTYITNTLTYTKVGECVCDEKDVEKARRFVAQVNNDATGIHHIAFSCSVTDEHMMKVCFPNGYNLQSLEDAYNTITKEIK